MKPYYQDEWTTIYHGKAEVVLPTLAPVDLLLTDPPYGIARTWKGGSGHGWGKADAQKEVRNEWDSEPPSRETLNAICSLAPKVCIWGGNYFELPPSRGWFVWNKPERDFTLAEAELAWTNLDTVIRVCDCRRSDPDRLHPTQKPLYLMRWCLTKLKTKPGDIVLDPYMGSGTTLRAAKDHGCRAIGVDINERYCEIAARRLQQQVFQFAE